MQNELPQALSTTTGASITPYYFTYPPLQNNQEIDERKLMSADAEAGMQYEIISPDGIHFLHWNILPGEAKTIFTENASPFFHFPFVIKNPVDYFEIHNPTNHDSIGNYEYNLFYFTANNRKIAWQPQVRTEIFVLNLQPGFIEKYLPDDHPVAKKLLGAIKKGKTLKAREQNLPLTPHLMGILLDILNCPLEKQYKRMFLKAKVIELLSVMLSQMDAFKQLKSKAGLRQEDVNKMQDAREKLHLNLQSPCSLIDLAHQVGTNENYLKKHFKLLYGNTVYGYINDLRMQQAKTMLKENISMPEIAQAIGYKNVNHFTAAFKKYFGYSPYTIQE